MTPLIIKDHTLAGKRSTGPHLFKIAPTGHRWPVAHDERYRDVELRLSDQDALDSVVEAWTRNKGATDVMEALQAKGVPAAVVQRPQDRLDH